MRHLRIYIGLVLLPWALILALWLAGCEAEQPPCSALVVIGSVTFQCLPPGKLATQEGQR